MKKVSRWVPVLVGALALGAGAIDAQAETKTETKGTTTSKSTSTMDDTQKVQSVMQFLHAANQAEIKLGKMAQTKAKNAEVKGFADRMVKDHTEADKNLSDLAGKKGIDLNATMTDPLYVAVTKMFDTAEKELSAKSGNMFDISYIADQPADHALVLSMIEEGQKAASKDADEKKLLDDMHTTIKAHKEHADRIVGKMTLPGGAAKGVGGGPGEQPKSTTPSKGMEHGKGTQNKGGGPSTSGTSGGSSTGGESTGGGSMGGSSSGGSMGGESTGGGSMMGGKDGGK